MINPRRVVAAYDPGVTTGFCVMQAEWPPLEQSLLVTRNIKTLEELVRSFTVLLETNKLEGCELVAIVVETFKLFPHMAKEQIGSDFPSSQIIGAIKLLAHLHQVTPLLVWQPPSIQTNWPNNQIKKYHLSSPNWTTHEYSATKHCLQWVRVDYNRTHINKKP